MTLDHLSGGRAILGAGAGHLESEFTLLGVDHASRGRAVEAAIPVIRAAFAEEYPTVGGPGAEVGVGMAPRPARAGGPPIWVGGSSTAAIRRAALLGDGWLPQGPPKMGTSAAIELIRTTREEAGLPVAFDLGVVAGPVFVGEPDVEVEPYATTGPPEQLAERLRRFTAKGMNQLQLGFRGRDANQVADQIERFGAEVAPLLEDERAPPLPPAGRFRRADRSPHRRRGPGRSAARRIGGCRGTCGPVRRPRRTTAAAVAYLLRQGSGHGRQLRIVGWVDQQQTRQVVEVRPPLLGPGRCPERDGGRLHGDQSRGRGDRAVRRPGQRLAPDLVDRPDVHCGGGVVCPRVGNHVELEVRQCTLGAVLRAPGRRGGAGATSMTSRSSRPGMTYCPPPLLLSASRCRVGSNSSQVAGDRVKIHRRPVRYPDATDHRQATDEAHLRWQLRQRLDRRMGGAARSTGEYDDRSRLLRSRSRSHSGTTPQSSTISRPLERSAPIRSAHNSGWATATGGCRRARTLRVREASAPAQTDEQGRFRVRGPERTKPAEPACPRSTARVGLLQRLCVPPEGGGPLIDTHEFAGTHHLGCLGDRRAPVPSRRLASALRSPRTGPATGAAGWRIRSDPHG